MKKIDIIGAGPTGLVLANLLSASDEYKVSVFEKRSESELFRVTGNKTINLTLSNRGLRTLAELGLEDRVREKSVPVIGRMLHRSDNPNVVQLYGDYTKKPKIHSIRRHDLLQVLYEPIANSERVTIHFGQEFNRLNKRENVFTCKDQDTGTENTHSLDLLLGCDG
ncbi:MAG: FAD-dependent monooxygenase, partial [Verrucomicrobiae bacterium]|nr:FAD-dependent monooxygenase [Verrucomicrobiae bacterium]